MQRIVCTLSFWVRPAAHIYTTARKYRIGVTKLRFVHMADLHIGKRVHGYSMIEEQGFILDQILSSIDEVKAGGVIIAGDIYDKSVPSAEAVTLFDSFLTRLSQRGIYTFIISGNHDSAERMAFGSKIMKEKNVFISDIFCGEVQKETIEDEIGPINIYLLPFIKPASVRNFCDVDVSTYNQAVGYVIGNTKIDEKERNILVAHQFITGAQRSDSEDISVGGIDNVDVAVFDAFDYVALGHIHREQYVGRDNVRYSGTPLKYSFSEVNHKKKLLIVDVLEKGKIVIEEKKLNPRRDLMEIKGTYMEITKKTFYDRFDKESYMHITLTDEEEVYEALGRLRTIYPNIMLLDYDNKRTRQNNSVEALDIVEKRDKMDFLKELYKIQNNEEMSEEQIRYATRVMEKIWQEGE